MKRCMKCDQERLLVTLHGDAGGPEVCLQCHARTWGYIKREKRRAGREKADLMRVLEGGGSFARGDGVELYRETLLEALQVDSPGPAPSGAQGAGNAGHGGADRAATRSSTEAPTAEAPGDT